MYGKLFMVVGAMGRLKGSEADEKIARDLLTLSYLWSRGESLLSKMEILDLGLVGISNVLILGKSCRHRAQEARTLSPSHPSGGSQEQKI